MTNRLTFSNAISILLEHKKKTYQQHLLVRNLFSVCLDDELSASDIYTEEHTRYSRWCTGVRPIPMEIVRAYEKEGQYDVMRADFRNKIIPNLINEAQARAQMEKLIQDNRDMIGDKTADDMIAIADNAAFFTAVIRYTMLCRHKALTTL
ncbi:MAG: hypothetical protein NC548_46660 [Lachnospiraceae bacterium]|nr:hypothetical protein [Lachnospiraceae bacterium]